MSFLSAFVVALPLKNDLELKRENTLREKPVSSTNIVIG